MSLNVVQGTLEVEAGTYLEDGLEVVVRGPEFLPTTIDNVNGFIDVLNLAGPLTTENINRDITIGFTTYHPETITVADTVNGAITVTLPSDASVTVLAETFLGGGTISTDFPEITIEKTDDGFLATGVLGAGEGHLELGTINGHIHIGEQARRPDPVPVK